AGSTLEGVYYEDLCFHTQQAAEKAIKARLIRRGIAFPYIHDLAQLLTLVEQSGQLIPANVRQAEDQPMATHPRTRRRTGDAPQPNSSVIQWLLDSDPSIRWQVLRDLI